MRDASLVSRVVGLAFALNAVDALAHHSFAAEFDANQPLRVTGTVTRVEWMNPHTWFYVDVKDAAGGMVSWGFELASPNLLMRNGWTRSAMKAGDVVTVEAFRAKNGSNNANARLVTLDATGQKLFTGSSSARREP